MKLASKLETYRDMIDTFLLSHNLKRDDIKTGSDAWIIASRSGVCGDAYAISRDITDGHIQTALEKLMPNAVFRDAKRY